MRLNLFAAVLGMLCVVGCGGSGTGNGGGGGGSGGPPPSGPNVQALTVDNGPPAVATSNTPAVNTLYTSVTICAPGTTACQTIDHIQVDTGSAGLRILTGVLQVNLPLENDSTGNTIAECTPFVDGFTWGMARLADIKIAGEIASNMAVQIIGDSAFPQPTDCTASTNVSVANFGANGILGVGAFVQDCGANCTLRGQNTYYTCRSTNSPNQCIMTPATLALQVSNPVAFFATDNNGVIVQLNPVNGTATSVSGSLIFGIGTQGNNGLGKAQVFGLSAGGELMTTYNNGPLPRSFIDSGSNAYFFPDPVIYVCGSQGETTSAKNFFCPKNGTLNLSATISGVNGTNSVVNFSVANANNLFSGTVIAAAAALAGPSTLVGTNDPGYDGSKAFDWGLPFYYGRSVYTAIEGQNTSAGLGPYFAF